MGSCISSPKKNNNDHIQKEKKQISFQINNNKNTFNQFQKKLDKNTHFSFKKNSKQMEKQEMNDQLFWYLQDQEPITSDKLKQKYSQFFLSEQNINSRVNIASFMIKNIQYPLTSIGLIHYCAPQVKQTIRRVSWGTGFLIKKNIILTCAHNLYNKDKNSFYQSLKFYPSLSGPLCIKYQIKNAYVPQQYKSQMDQSQFRKYDFGIAVIDNLKKNSKQLEVLPISCEQINQKQTVQVYGYPENPNNSQNQRYMYRSIGQFIRQDEWRIYYQAETSPGYSGSPIIRQSNNGYEAIGIHTFSSDQAKSGIKISKKVLQQIQLWINQDKLKN